MDGTFSVLLTDELDEELTTLTVLLEEELSKLLVSSEQPHRISGRIAAASRGLFLNFTDAPP